MFAKIETMGEVFKTEKAVLFVDKQGKEMWLPKYVIKDKKPKHVIINKDFAVKNKIIHTEVSLLEVIDKDLKPLKHLILPDCGGYLPPKAMEHQKNAFKFASGLKSVALFMDMGTGKSKLYIDLAEYHFKNGNIDNVLFFAPVTTLDNFKNEIKKWATTNLSWDIKSINFLSQNPLLENMVNFINAITPRTLVIIDESHRIKNLSSNACQNAHIIGYKTDFKIIGTGTPCPNNAVDLLGQFRFLTPAEFPETKTALKKKWQRIGNYGVLNGCKNEIGLVSKTNVYTFSVKKDDCLDLPEVNNVRIEHFNEEILKHINNYRSEINKQFLDSEGTVMGYLQNLRKLATGRDLEDKIVVKNPRIEILKEILADIFDKTIIWHSFYKEIEDITEVIDAPYVFLNGNMSEKERIYAISEFKTNKHIKYLIATTAVGGIGLNLTEAKNNIYFSNGFNLADKLQSMARTHRIGQTEHVNNYDIIVKKTIDSQIDSSLIRKKDFLTEVTELYKLKGKAGVIDYLK